MNSWVSEADTFRSKTRGDRAEMLSALESERFPCKIGLDHRSYDELLDESVFALAPYGNNQETHRFWEAVQRGAIPVIKRVADHRADFVNLTGIPAIQLDSWFDISRILGRYLPHDMIPSTQAPKDSFLSSNAAEISNRLASLEDLDELQDRILNAYDTFISRTRMQSADLIEDNFRRYST